MISKDEKRLTHDFNLDNLTIALASTDRAARLAALYMLDDYVYVSRHRPYSAEMSDLLSLAIHSFSIKDDNEIIEQLLFVILQAFSYQSPEVCLDPLLNKIDEIASSQLEYVITILGLSHKSAYKTIVEKYVNHEMSGVRIAASQAMGELQEK